MTTIKKAIKGNARLQENLNIVKNFGEEYERAYQQLNTFYAEAYRDQSFYLGRIVAQNKVSLIDLELLAA